MLTHVPKGSQTKWPIGVGPERLWSVAPAEREGVRAGAQKPQDGLWATCLLPYVQLLFS